MKQPVVNEKLLKNFEDGYAAFSSVVLRGKFFHQAANPISKKTPLDAVNGKEVGILRTLRIWRNYRT